MDFDLRQLHYARALAEEGSFARAARALQLTQPALSRSIQELERRTGIKLFDRTQGRVEPTALGQVFIAHARELLGHAEALDREVATMRGTGTGSLAVGSGTFPTAIFMAEALGIFLGRNPGVAVRIVNDNWVALVAALRRRELDIVVAAPPAAEDASDLQARLLTPRQGYFLTRTGHPLLARPAPSLADVVAFPIVSTSRLGPAITGSLLEAWGDHAGGRSIPDVACESHEMMRRIVASTDHVMIATLAANARAIDEGELVPLPVADRRVAATFAIIRVESRTLSPIADELIADVIAADRVAAEAERLLALRLFGAPARTRSKGAAAAPRTASTAVAR